ncbi:hypothetical protein [Paenibacillus sp. y28]
MNKKTYSKPAVFAHEPIVFETGYSNCIEVCGWIICPDGNGGHNAYPKP